MSLRLPIVCGVCFTAGLIAAAAATVTETPRRAMAALHARLTACPLPGLRCAPEGVFLHQRTSGAPPVAVFGLPDPKILVSSAWADLSAGPARLAVPPTGDRFFAIQIIDAFGDTVGVMSADSVGTGGGSLLLTREAGAGGVAVPSDRVWIVARFEIADEGDEAAVHAVQDGLRIARDGRRAER